MHAPCSWGLLCLISSVVLVIEPKLSQATEILHLKIYSILGGGGVGEMKSVLPLAHHKEFRQRFHMEENPVSSHLLHYVP